MNHNPRDITYEMVTPRGKLIMLFYLLVRDHLLPGKLFALIQDMVKSTSSIATYSSPAMLQLGKELVSDLLGEESEEEMDMRAEIEHLRGSLKGQSNLIVALMERLGQNEVEFSERQLAMMDNQTVWFENYSDPQRGGRFIKMTLRPVEPVEPIRLATYDCSDNYDCSDK